MNTATQGALSNKVTGVPARRACRSLADGTKEACPGWLGSAGWPAGAPSTIGVVEPCSNRHPIHRPEGSHRIRSSLSVTFIETVLHAPSC